MTAPTRTAPGRATAGPTGTAPAKPPVTAQADYATALLPWIREVQEALGIEDEALDVDRLHAMTGVVAHEVQRSMAPISSYLVGLAVARGAALEEACAALERATTER